MTTFQLIQELAKVPPETKVALVFADLGEGGNRLEEKLTVWHTTMMCEGKPDESVFLISPTNYTC